MFYHNLKERKKSVHILYKCSWCMVHIYTCVLCSCPGGSLVAGWGMAQFPATAPVGNCFAKPFMPYSQACPDWNAAGIWEWLCPPRSQAGIWKHLVFCLLLEWLVPCRADSVHFRLQGTPLFFFGLVESWFCLGLWDALLEVLDHEWFN